MPTKPTIEENAGSPNVTAIGATEVLDAQYDQSGIDTGVGTPAEQVWFFDIQHLLLSASTGGVSAVFKKPAFQKGIKSAKFGKRAVPDVCLGGGFPARPGYWECLDFGLLTNGTATHTTCTNGGGTSIAAPQWAGVLALVVQKKGARVGNIDAQLYAMAKANLGNLAAVGIRDVTQGNNGYFPLAGYDAGPGYDLASGWGSIDIATFVDAFVGFVPHRK
jgi:subtilase family serine protease